MGALIRFPWNSPCPFPTSRTARSKTRRSRPCNFRKEIVSAFLKLNGEKAPANAAPTPAPVPQGTRATGREARLCPHDRYRQNQRQVGRAALHQRTGDRRCRLFGSADQLALQIAPAGYHMNPEDIEDARLNVACLVVPKPSADGRYLTIARVAPRTLNWLLFLRVPT